MIRHIRLSVLPLATALLFVGVGTPALAQEERALSLDEAMELAIDGNEGVEAMRLRVQEMDQRSSLAFTNYLPRLETRANYVFTNNTQGILIPAGALGTFPNVGDFPPADTEIPQGGQDLFFTFTTLAQPLTQYFKIREGRGVTQADLRATEAELRSMEQEVSLGALQLYAGLLMARRGIEVARVRVEAAAARATDREVAVTSGTAAQVAGREARVRWLQARQDLLEKEGEVDELEYQLADLLGLPATTRLVLDDPAVPDVEVGPLEQYVRMAARSNTDIAEARALVDKGEHGVGAARAEYIPEIALLGTHVYQSSVPFFPTHSLGLGLTGSWTILDFGARGNTIRERRAQLGQAEQNLAVVEGRVRGEVEAVYRKIERARELVELSSEALSLQTEGTRLRALQASTGYAVPAEELEARADLMQAELDALGAALGYRIALAELEKAAGTLTPDSSR